MIYHIKIPFLENYSMKSKCGVKLYKESKHIKRQVVAVKKLICFQYFNGLFEHGEQILAMFARKSSIILCEVKCYASKYFRLIYARSPYTDYNIYDCRYLGNHDRQICCWVSNKFFFYLLLLTHTSIKFFPFMP